MTSKFPSKKKEKNVHQSWKCKWWEKK